ncbi:MAG TPA: A/G-specific adenine glycosylase [Caulobacteraceae bacterium]|nr:A/G-specific adenine glycosylase [Caulobacteraceae bacterium]
MTAVAAIRRRVLAWYDAHRRTLPWRAAPGEMSDPYRVWLSEIMLQQTTAAHAAPYFADFIGRWPTVESLASAADEEVMSAWAGLGYYARARNLLACARAMSAEGGIPREESALARLPGVGPYTAAAIAAIAFDAPANAVDANIERVMARLFRIQTPLPAAKPELRARAAELVTGERCGDWTQALMDLGALVCRPTRPACAACPLRVDCAARAAGDPETYPRRTPRAERPRRHGAAFVALAAGEVALTRRPPSGLLGGMLGLPTTEWAAHACNAADMLEAAPWPAAWRRAGIVTHVFTHFALELAVWRADIEPPRPAAIWRKPEGALSALPSVFAKALRAAL